MDDSDEQMSSSSSDEDSETESDSDSDSDEGCEDNGHSLQNFEYDKKTLKSLHLLCYL